MTERADDGQTPDIDAMSDADFAAFKEEMAREPAKPDPEPKPEPQDRPAPEQDDDGDDNQGDDDAPLAAKDKPETVPHGQFHRERERRKQLEQQFTEAQRRYELLEQRTNAMLQMMASGQQGQQPQEPQPDPVPDRLGDPLGYMEYMDRRLQQFEQGQRQQTEAQQRQQQEQRLIAEVTSRAGSDFQQAVQEDPAYQEAYEFMFRAAVQEKMAVEGLPEQHAIQVVRQQELGLYAQALQAGRRPSAVIRALAQARGWQPKAPEQGKPDIEQAAAKIERLNQTKDAAKSLSGAGSEARTGIPTPDDLVNMTDDEFMAYKNKHGERALSRAFLR